MRSVFKTAYTVYIGFQEGYLNPIFKEDAPLSTYHIDHLGPNTATKKMYKFLLVIFDAFSKFVWIYPTESTSSAEVFQQEVFGSPNRIIADRGTAFTSNAFEEYCEEEAIRHVKTTTGVARGNGQVERINNTIISILDKLSVKSPEEWFKNVGKVQQALNSTFQRSIKTSPFELLFWTKMKGSISFKEEIEDELLAHFQ